MTGPLPPEVEALALGAIEREVKKRKKVAAAIIGQGYLNGTTRHFLSPLGGKLGYVARSNPEPSWEVHDRAALDAHLATFPGCVEEIVDVAPEDMPEVLAVLAEHAPHLIRETTRIRPDAVRDALAQSAATGKPAAPGIRLGAVPGGTVTVTPDPDAVEVVGRLISAGVLTWDGRPVLGPGDGVAS